MDQTLREIKRILFSVLVLTACVNILWHFIRNLPGQRCLEVSLLQGARAGERVPKYTTLLSAPYIVRTGVGKETGCRCPPHIKRTRFFMRRHAPTVALLHPVISVSPTEWSRGAYTER